MCVLCGYICMCTNVHRAQRHQMSLELELQVVVNHPSWVLRFELEFFACLMCIILQGQSPALKHTHTHTKTKNKTKPKKTQNQNQPKKQKKLGYSFSFKNEKMFHFCCMFARHNLLQVNVRLTYCQLIVTRFLKQVPGRRVAFF